MPERRPSARSLRRLPAGYEFQFEEALPDDTAANAATAAPSTNRPRATPSREYLRRSHIRLRQQRSAADLDQFDYIFAQPSRSNPSAVTPNTNTRTRRLTDAAEPLDMPPRQAKRRKIEHNTNQTSPYDGFRYGYKGQEAAGRLKMEVVSCDGGEYKRVSTYGLYPVTNVLKNDKSVYCSDRPDCNLLLQHIADMPFTLEKVVIRAPDRGFTAPYVLHSLCCLTC
jgi:hypothetical protein